jgi:hypothetical protein
MLDDFKQWFCDKKDFTLKTVKEWFSTTTIDKKPATDNKKPTTVNANPTTSSPLRLNDLVNNYHTIRGIDGVVFMDFNPFKKGGAMRTDHNTVLHKNVVPDLKDIAEALGIDGFKTMRKAELLDAIQARF